MKSKALRIMILSVAMMVGSAGAVLLVEETWDYGVGSAASSWTNGVGFTNAAWDVASTGTTLDEGLSFGAMQVEGGSAHIQFTAGGGFSASTLGRQLDMSSITNGPLWMAYLFRFDTERSTILNDEFLEVRPGAGNFRSKINEDTMGVGLRYGGDYTISPSHSYIKGGKTLLYVMRWPDLGQTTGGDAKGWVLTDLEYNNMMTSSNGLSEANLDSHALVTVTNSFEADATLAGNVSMQLVPAGRNSSTPSFYVDELRMGTALDDVVAGLDTNLSTGITLVYEDFDYTIGSPMSNWNGGVGLSTNAWYEGSITAGTTLETSLTNGLSFGDMQVGGGAMHIHYAAGSAFSAAALKRQMNNYGVNSNDLWIAYLFKFDTAQSTTPEDEWFEFRAKPFSGNYARVGLDEEQSRCYMEWGSSTAKSYTDANSAIKGGTTVLFVFKVPDLGLSSTSQNGRGWVLDATGYGNMIANGGISEANLDAYALAQGTRNPYIVDRLAGNVTFELVPQGRDSSTTSFFIDEWRVGLSAMDVIGAPYPPSGQPTIIDLSVHSGNIMKMVVNAPGRLVDYSLAATTDLSVGSWNPVAHSDDGVHSFVVTNLEYSTTDVSGSNEVVYVNALGGGARFYRIEVQ